MPARKLAGAAMAAASNRRLMVMPPDVIATTVAEPLCALKDCVASLVRAGVDGITTRPEPTWFSPSWPAAGRNDADEKVGLIPFAPGSRPSPKRSFGSVMNLDFI